MKPAPAFLKAPSAWDPTSPRLSGGSVDSSTSTSSGKSWQSRRPLMRTSQSGASTLTLDSKTTSETFYFEGDDAHPSWFDLAGDDPDRLHDFSPSERAFKKLDARGSIFTMRGLLNLGTLAFLACLILFLFAGYPTLAVLRGSSLSAFGAFNLGGTNGSGQVPVMFGNFGLIDKDTPAEALTYTSLQTGEVWELVFSDEFEEEGRTFWPGDDPYWEAEDLHYWATNNLEWYVPQQIETKNGALVITLDKRAHRGMDYVGGLLTTWNKFCFTGGYIETAVRLPGRSDIYGLWPATWTMGNLGRAGYGGTLDGMWPYTYDSCDVGTLPNQTLNGLPEVATTSGTEGDPGNGVLSFLPGQRLSACTCPSDETHPGPRYTDGSFRGRSAPEIDIIEAQVDPVTLIGHVSQSAQWAPFNPAYGWLNTSANLAIDDESISHLNPYMGGVYQQATSVVSTTNQDCYEYASSPLAEPCFSVYGFEYKPGLDGYIRWINDGKSAWTLQAAGMAANAEAEVGSRPVPYEPMYILSNLGLSLNFGAIDFEGLEDLWPVHMLVDHVRVYQRSGSRNIGCDPPDAPTAAYIERYADAYANANLTTWDQATHSAPLPRNRLVDTC